MSMYLPNPDVGPIGAEPGEFIDWPLLSDDGPQPPPAQPHPHDEGDGDGATERPAP